MKCPCCNNDIKNAVGIRWIDVKMFYDTDPHMKFRPLSFIQKSDDQALDNVADCDKTRYLFDYTPKFLGYKNKRIIVMEVET